MGRQTITIRCEVEVADDSLIGSASRCGGEAYEFTGWLGLIGVLQALLVDAESNGGSAGRPR